MINFRYIFALSGVLVLVLSACEKTPVEPVKPVVNPFTAKVDWNGFVFDTTRYHTPSAFLENWGENLDSLSSDFDIKFTDGIFDDQLHNVRNYSILVYFDANSPSVNEFSEGTYTVENTVERKPGNIVEAWVELSESGKLYKYQITSGTVVVEKKDGFMLISYNAMLNNSHNITGQFTGSITPIVQVLK